MDLHSHTALLGGSFNPPHIGHLRIAQEVIEACNPAKLLLIPSAAPPHKPSDHLLPFTMRRAMLQECLAGQEAMEVSSIEHNRPGPSYTVDTLRAFHSQGLTRLLFVMGLDDVPMLPSWKDWEYITDLADIAALPRTCRCDADPLSKVKGLWPDAQVSQRLEGGGMRIALGAERSFWYLPQPILEVSSSLVRSRWLAGRSIEHLVPGPVLDFLRRHGAEARAVWTDRQAACS